MSKKLANNAGKPTVAEFMEERRLAQGDVNRLLMIRNQNRVAISHGLYGVKEAVVPLPVMLNRNNP